MTVLVQATENEPSRRIAKGSAAAAGGAAVAAGAIVALARARASRRKPQSSRNSSMLIPRTNPPAKLSRPQQQNLSSNRAWFPTPRRRAVCRRGLRPRRRGHNRRQLRTFPAPKPRRPNRRRGAARPCASRRRKYWVMTKALLRNPSHRPCLRSSPSCRVRRRARPIARAGPVGGASVCSARANRVSASIRTRPSVRRARADLLQRHGQN